MIRVLAILIGLASLAPGQNVGGYKAFFSAVEVLPQRTADGAPIDAAVRIQEETGLSPAGAQAALNAALAYGGEAQRIDQSLRRAIFTRRLQVAGEFRVSYSEEKDLVNWANLDLNLLAYDRMDELREALGLDEAEKLTRFIALQTPANVFFPLRPGERGGVPEGPPPKQTPLEFWRNVVKTPLSMPGAQAVFDQNYKDALLPPPGSSDYLEGTVVSVVPAAGGGQLVMLAMEPGAAPEAALRIDSEPAVGSTVRFRGYGKAFTAAPFLIVFVPEWISRQ